MTHSAEPTGWVGRPMLRREDRTLVTGRGRFVDDLGAAGALHLLLARSPHAHARVRSVDTTAARRAPGVVAVFTAADLEHVKNPLGKSHHAFEVGWEDLKSAEALFSARGVPNHAPIDWGDHDCLYFLDPDGNLLELVGYRPKGHST